MTSQCQDDLLSYWYKSVQEIWRMERVAAAQRTDEDGLVVFMLSKPVPCHAELSSYYMAHVSLTPQLLLYSSLLSFVGMEGMSLMITNTFALRVKEAERRFMFLGGISYTKAKPFQFPNQFMYCIDI